MPVRRVLRALLSRYAVVLIYAAMYGLCAVAIESIMESAEHGRLPGTWASLDAWAFVIGISAAAAIFFVDALPKGDMRRQLECLPFGGRGWKFIALSAGAQVGIGLLSQVGASDGDAAGDMAASLIVIVLMALFSWLFVSAVARMIPKLAGAIAPMRLRPLASSRTLPQAASVDLILAGYAVWPPALFNRPPPQLSAR
ncbi:MAG: hypothetical protein GIW99_09415 [Candidatus Eremiobacteraeota bacterium]|nr:hypothetical protein [Candidatus Eremiobacteraeota bacterium]MBC5827880.1 hypothetical protein [Candidatus Eremiobacteraeota bacterium]